MTKNSDWHTTQIREHQFKIIRKLAFPDPSLKIKVLTAALLDEILKDEVAVQKVCNKLRRELTE